MKDTCLYCKNEIKDKFIVNKIGIFCSEKHFDEYLKSLSKEEYIKVQNSFCVCSDE